MIGANEIRRYSPTLADRLATLGRRPMREVVIVAVTGALIGIMAVALLVHFLP
jgi:hypothetical protein